MRTKRVGVKLAATAGVVAVAMTAFAPAAAAASADRSAAKARFLSGTAGGRSFDTVAALKGVAVERSGDDGKVKQANTFQGSVLGQPLPGQPKGINVPIGDLIKIGAANQYAKASPRAKAVAASGAVANGGAINTTGDTNFPADATLDLAKVPGLPKQVTEQLLDLKLRIGAISSVAAMNANKGHKLATRCADLSDPKQCRDYNIAGADLTLKLQPLKTLFDKLKPLKDTLNGEETSNLQGVCGGIPDEAGTDVEDACHQIDKAGAGTIDIRATPPNLQAILDSATKSTTKNGLAVDLTEGTVVLDLEKFLQSVGLDLNNLPPNTELVQYIVKALATTLPDALNTSLSKVSESINQEMGKAGLEISVGGNELPALNGKAASDVVGPLIEQLSAQADDVTGKVQSAFGPGLDQLGALSKLLAIYVNVQDSPSDGVYRETAMKVVLGEGAAGMGGGSLGSPAAAAGDGGAVEVNLARAQVRASLGQEEPPAEDVPAGGPPPGPNLPNTGAGTLDLPFLLLGLGLVTGGLWIIMYGRSEQLEQ